MDKTPDSHSSSQKYSVIKNDDFEEASFEESGTQRAAILATHEPCQNAWYLAAKFLISREVLVIHLMWLLVLVLSIFCLRFATSDMNCANSRLPSDEVFGESAFYQFGRGIETFTKFATVPFRVVSWAEDEGFVNSDPMDGKRWNQSRENGAAWTPWDDIHPGQLNQPWPSNLL
jgi:hypothetical protein